MATLTPQEKAIKWLDEWKYDLSFINTNTLLAAFMEGFRYGFAEKVIKENGIIDWIEYNEKSIEAYQKGIDWVMEYNETYSGTFFTRACVIRAYLKGQSLNI